jgi:chaperonin GroES
MQTIKPASKHLFCVPKEASTKTNSGLLLTSKTAEKPHMADVINVGSEVKNYKSKDTIIYKPYATTEIKLAGKEYFLVAEEDVLGSVIETE